MASLSSRPTAGACRAGRTGSGTWARRPAAGRPRGRPPPRTAPRACRSRSRALDPAKAGEGGTRSHLASPPPQARSC
eukprot:2188258-Pyramimonas_sp.AAC.1